MDDQTPDHLWPARAEYLQRGTPVVTPNAERTYVENVGMWRRTGTIRVLTATGSHFALDDLHINLNNDTARAHAAMAYTVVDAGRVDVTKALAAGVTAQRLAAGATFASRAAVKAWQDSRYHVETLKRMRALDESVTVAEARAALAWAESMMMLSKKIKNT